MKEKPFNNKEIDLIVLERKEEAKKKASVGYREDYTTIPITSLTRLKDDMSWQSREWNIAEPSTESGSWIKRIVKKSVKKMLNWYITPMLEQQRKFNLRAVRILDDAVQVISYMQEKEIFSQIDEISQYYSIEKGKKEEDFLYTESVNFLIVDDLDEVEYILKALLIFHYYNRLINSKSHLFLVLKNIESDIHLQCVMVQISELKIRNIHTVFNPDENSLRDYCKMSKVYLSLSGNKENVEYICELVNNSEGSKIGVVPNIDNIGGENIIYIEGKKEEEVAEMLDMMLRRGH